MKFRLGILPVLVVLLASACAQMDTEVTDTRQVVSAVTVDSQTNQEFVVELAYTGAVTYEEAVVLVNNITVVHETGVSVVDENQTVLEQSGLLYEDPRFTDLSDHVFEVNVYSETLDLSQILDDYRWAWVEDNLVEFIKHCPPGHGG